jgi:hypothetical protein
MEKYLVTKTEQERVEFPSDDDTSGEEENTDKDDEPGEEDDNENIDFVMGNLGLNDSDSE